MPQDGNYTFYTTSDDGVSVNVCRNEKGFPCGDDNGSVNWDIRVSGPGEGQSASIPLKRGTHNITVQFFESVGRAYVKLYGSGPGFNKQIIPNGNLNPSLIGPPSTSPSAQADAAPAAEAIVEGAEMAEKSFEAPGPALAPWLGSPGP